jgi:predicted nucleic acid-binding protein
VSTFFLDSSAIIKYYVTEPGSTWIRSLVSDPGNVFVISEIAIVEVAAALSQLHRAKIIGRTHRDRSLDRFQSDLRTGRFLSRVIDITTIERAANLALTHAVKGYDAVQVASCALAEEVSNTPITFVSGDRQALRAAQRSALEVENPFDHLDDDQVSDTE